MNEEEIIEILNEYFWLNDVDSCNGRSYWQIACGINEPYNDKTIAETHWQSLKEIIAQAIVKLIEEKENEEIIQSDLDDFYKKGIKMLEDKIKEYLDRFVTFHFENLTNTTLAKNIAEIVNEENSSVIDHEYCRRWLDSNKKKLIELEKENVELKLEVEKYKGRYEESMDKLVEKSEINKKFKQQLKEYELINRHHVDLIGRQEQQLADIKYLNRDKVEKIIRSIFGSTWGTGKEMYDFSHSEETLIGAITAICNLAYEPITKDKIINIIKDHYWDSLTYYMEEQQDLFDKHFEFIALEILNNKSDKEE